jgi:Ice-binding-like/Bacterial Ig-like domain
MRKLKVSKIWIPAFLLAVVMSGCGDSDKGGGGGTGPLNAPTVVSVFPTGAAKGVCQAVLVTATFSKAMDPATINTGTFTLAAGTTPVTGTVSLDSTDTIATFTPANPLALNTAYTATITTGARDQFGNALAANFTWMFTTNATPCPGPFGLPGCGFGILAGSTVTNTSVIGPTNTNVTGDVGVWPGTAITGFPPGTLTGQLHSADGTAKAAQDQLTLAYNAAAGAPGGAALPGMIGGPGTAPFPPGVYKATSTLLIVGDITLDGSTNPNGTWIFQVGTALTTQAGAPGAPGSQVLLTGGAVPKNVFWQLGSSGTIGTYALFQGTIMANQSITLGTGATLNGRALAEKAAVSLDNNKVNVPPCP